MYSIRLLSIKGSDFPDSNDISPEQCLVFPITNTCAFAFVITNNNDDSRQNIKVYLNIPAVHFGKGALMTQSNIQ